VAKPDYDTSWMRIGRLAGPIGLLDNGHGLGE